MRGREEEMERAVLRLFGAPPGRERGGEEGLPPPIAIHSVANYGAAAAAVTAPPAPAVAVAVLFCDDDDDDSGGGDGSGRHLPT